MGSEADLLFEFSFNLIFLLFNFPNLRNLGIILVCTPDFSLLKKPKIKKKKSVKEVLAFEFFFFVIIFRKWGAQNFEYHQTCTKQVRAGHPMHVVI